jgi:hypothetical protein
VIVAGLAGGLGNQMFQYAAGRRLALARGTSLKLDRAPLVGSGRAYALDHLLIEASFAAPEEIPPRKRRRRAALACLLPGRRGGGAATATRVRQRGSGFDPAVLDLPDDVYLDGYWQSERYFQDIADTIRRDFTFAAPPVGRNAELLEAIDAAPAASVHVRRGDYVSDPKTNAYHGVCGGEYFARCAEEILDRAGAAHFFVFSDEPEWARANLRLPATATVVDHNPPEDGHEDLRLMSRCRHHVIANSSFSWWAAWLNPRPDKLVFAPRHWFGSPDLDDSTIVPDGWHRR